MITINVSSISPKLLERPLPRLTSKLIAEGHSSPCHQLNQIASLILQYLLVTGAYLAFRISDGILFTLVMLDFHQLCYSRFDNAFYFFSMNA